MTPLLNCNQKLVYNIASGIKPGYVTPFHQILTQNWKETLDLYEKNNFSLDHFLYDRSGVLEHYIKVDKTACPIPVAGDFNDSLDRVITDRAKYLLSLGKPIKVCWSGGIDSTTILLTLLDLAEDKDQVKVYGTYNSILESGSLFDNYIRKKVRESNIEIHPSFVDRRLFYSGDFIYLTGSCGNQLFYQDTNYSSTRDKFLRYKTLGDKTEYISKNADSPYQACLEDSTLEFISGVIAKSERKIETLQDLRWYLNFNFKWHTVKYDTHRELSVERCTNIINFFDTDEFQKWSISNKDPVTLTGDYSDERWQLRGIISNYLGDNSFSSQKKNITSTSSYTTMEWMCTLNDYTQVYFS